MAPQQFVTVRDVLARDLGQKIEEIVKVDQVDEQAVHQEMTEYVVTDRLREHYKTILRAIRDSQTEPHEGVGVWVSGFFGSGKSFFAKNLGYILANPVILGQPASELFKARVRDTVVADLIDSLNASIPCEVVMFDVSVEKSVKTGAEKMAEIMYRVLLRQLGYAEDFDLAEVEFQLEGEGRLQDFTKRCLEKYGQDWERVRKGASKYTRTSALLHELDPDSHPTPDSWMQGITARPADITVGDFVGRAFDMCARRRPGKALIFIIDEVGQYIARSAEKMEDLRAVVEQFGLQGANRVKKRQTVAPTWLIVTSQEKLEEVVAALDSTRVELARLQDRFRYRIDLAPADIREVATRRVLGKTPQGAEMLRDLFRAKQGQLNAACRLERTSRTSDVREDEFVQFYPYLPHFVELSIDIVSGIRLQPGATRHLGGSNRTIIKQAYEMLVSDRTRLADAPVGSLVTLDKVFELVEGNLSSEKQKDISDIAARFGGNGPHDAMPVRVAKAIALLEYVRDLPRTPHNIAACLVSSVDTPLPLAEVGTALQELKEAQFVRETEEGWKLQTAQEKNWESERRTHLDPKPRERTEILRGVLKEIFDMPGLKTVQWRSRTFRLGAEFEGTSLGESGQIVVSVSVANSPERLDEELARLRTASRESRERVFCLMTLDPAIDQLVAELHASRTMMGKYERIRAENRITPDEAACLQAENAQIANLQRRLRDKVYGALHAGQVVFQGVSKNGPELGKSFEEALRQELLDAIPELYPKLPMAAVSIKGNEVETLLKAVDLNGLPPVLYVGDSRLGLVKKQGSDYVIDTSAPVASELLTYLEKEHSYGNKETRTGKWLEARFGGLGYGWDLEVLKLILAALFRAGAIEVSSGGMRYDSYLEGPARDVFLKNPLFRAAVFTPAKVIDSTVLKRAVEEYETLTGQTVQMDKNGIAAALKQWAEGEKEQVVPVRERLRWNEIPGLSTISEYEESLDRICGGTAEECVTLLAGEGTSLRALRDRIHRLGEATDGQTLDLIKRARQAVREIAPILERRAGGLPEVSALEALLESENFCDTLWDIRERTDALFDRYTTLYWEIHDKRTVAYDAVLEGLRGRPEWAELPEDLTEPIVALLRERRCESARFGVQGIACAGCGASVAQMESDLAAVDGLRSKALARLIELSVQSDAPSDGQKKTVRVRAVDLVGVRIESPEEVDEVLERLRSRLLELLYRGVVIIIE